MSAALRPDAITDFGQFATLRADARAQSPEALRKTAQQFEALLTQQMLKSMRAASPGDELMGGGQTEFYRDLFDQQMSVHLSSGKGMGIADLLVRQLQGRAPPAAAEAEAASAQNLPPPRAPTSFPALPFALASRVAAPASAPDSMPDAATRAAQGVAAQSRALLAGGAGPRPQSTEVAPVLTAPAPAQTTHLQTPKADIERGWRPRSPAEFVDAVRPHAEAAAAELGVPARVLIAQAALETGWGRKAIRRDDGASSFNLFGIKADRRWQGEDVQRTTTEYRNGQAGREAARFRAYDSVGESFADYVRFLKSNPRYAEALRHDGSEQRFVGGLQRAGYATDPDYAQKIMRVAYGRTMNAALTPSRQISV